MNEKEVNREKEGRKVRIVVGGKEKTSRELKEGQEKKTISFSLPFFWDNKKKMKERGRKKMTQIDLKERFSQQEKSIFGSKVERERKTWEGKKKEDQGMNDK